ncbi:MAG: M20/M25/M40 family metallo-hydrolase [Candidatus Caldarchaeum sp.]|nr:M20/M25/M40 family metallo-hydrolase [Candidatus Caldarchaeum sp.]
MERYGELFNYIERNKPKYLDWASRLISQPSVSAHRSGLRECAELVAELCEEAGLRTSIHEVEGGGPVVLGYLNSEAHATLMFYNHYDVQPADPVEKWTTPPFSPTVRNEKLYGRGAADNKGNIAARLAALDALTAVLGEVPVNIKMLVEGGEEVGSPGLKEFVERERDRLFADGCIWEYGYRNRKGSPVVYLGVKGMLYVEVEATGPGREVHSSWGAIVENPAWRLVQALNTIRTSDGRILLDGVYDEIDYSGEELLANLSLEDFDPPANLIPGKTGNLLKQLLLEPAVNINGLSSGYQGPGSKTIIPATASAKLDFRVVPKQDPEKIYRKLVETLRMRGFDDLKLRMLQSYPAARTSPDSFMAKLVADTAEQAYGVQPVVIPSGAASGPMYVITDILGVPCVSTGVGYHGSSVHGPDENIRIQDFVAGVKHMALVMLNFHRYMHLAE